ncbi:MAG: hypothetical protein Q7K55_01985 [Candidatus Levybacteria bacterium]|nr:hypothetical protein [Candidatus Levybacteria bacterium]
MENINQQTQDSGIPPTENRFLNFFPSPKGFIVFILIVLIMAGIASYSLSQRGKEKIPVPPPSPSKVPEISSQMIVYGAWIDNKSFIKGFDLQSKKGYLLAELPINIKKVTVLSPSQLLYIGDTNSKDHGQNISLYNISTKQTNIIYNAEQNFGIDDYVLSKNKKYISVWEVAFKPNSLFLVGGNSRVYSANVGNVNSKNLIYDEVADRPIHYPRAITSDGRIFFDTFLPNSGARPWAYGMSVSNFSGTEKKDLENMKNGTYGTQPDISPDENYLVFAGYSGSAIDGIKKEEKTEMRNAVHSPNTVELLDVKTLTRAKIDNFSTDNVYYSTHWSNIGNIIVSIISEDKNKTGMYSYSTLTSSLSKINLNERNNYVSAITSSTFLLGEPNVSISATGNLGGSYASTYRAFSVFDNNTNQTTELDISDSIIQFINILPPNYFQTLGNLKEENRSALQLYTFNLKPSLPPKREQQQTDPPKLPDNPPPGTYDPCAGLTPDNPFYDFFCLGDPQGCRNREFAWIQQQCSVNPDYYPGYPTCYDYWNNHSEFGCMGTPLYIYGQSKQNIDIKLKDYGKDWYKITLLDGGLMEFNGKVYDKIDYEFPSKNVTPPNYGIVTSSEKLKEVLTFYAKSLGLNTKETNDLVDYGNKNIKSPFVFVSFFDQKTSEQILPLEFNPKPDTYINIVFYFKELKTFPSILPSSPTFPAILERKGLTVVEISEIVDK